MKNFLETAISNQVGLWNGYASINSKYGLDQKFRYLSMLFGQNCARGSIERVKNMFEKKSYMNGMEATVYQSPKNLNGLTIVDKNLEHCYGKIGKKALRVMTQCNISYTNKIDGVKNYHDFSNLKFWLIFRVKPNIKLEKRTFHSVYVTLKFIEDCDKKNLPQFEFQVSVPSCFIEESNRNPNFINEIREQLGI